MLDSLLLSNEAIHVSVSQKTGKLQVVKFLVLLFSIQTQGVLHTSNFDKLYHCGLLNYIAHGTCSISFECSNTCFYENLRERRTVKQHLVPSILKQMAFYHINRLLFNFI